MFQDMMNIIDNEIASSIIKHSLHVPEEDVFKNAPKDLRHDSVNVFAGVGAQQQAAAGPVGEEGPPVGPQQPQRQHSSQTPTQREEPKVGRNDPCPCGSGKKYKKCCG